MTTVKENNNETGGNVIPWVVNMRKRLVNTFDTNFTKWVKVVLDLSNNQDDITQWSSVFEEHFEDLCVEIVSDIEKLQSSYISKIEGSLSTIKDQCKILQIEMPEFGKQKKSLNEEHMYLLKQIEMYHQQIESRRDEVDVLNKKELEVCTYLGKDPKKLKDNHLPSSSELEEFRAYLEQLEEERFCRIETYCSVKHEIICIIDELGYKPESSFEKEVIESHLFPVTDENMELLNSFHQHIQKLITDVKEENRQLWNKIEKLWNILDIPLLEREKFKQANKGKFLSTMELLKKELYRCQELKKKNIRKFIENLRSALEIWWTKSHCDKEQAGKTFHYYNCDCYTEDLLSLFEAEVDKWSLYYEQNKKLIKLLEKHKEFWHKMKTLEENSQNPSRFNNRGGQLLKEEKERNAVSKKIPVLEKELLELADQFYKKNGVHFQTFGQTIEEYIGNLRADQENNKKKTSSACKSQSKLLPTKSVVTGSASKQAVSKRKLLFTPHDQKKRPKLSKTPLTEPQMSSKQ